VPESSSETWDTVVKPKMDVPTAYYHPESGDVRHDLLVLQMLEKVAVHWPESNTRRVLLAISLSSKALGCHVDGS